MNPSKQLRTLVTQFFAHWYNKPGQNTEEGFDNWIESYAGQICLNEVAHAGPIETPFKQYTTEQAQQAKAEMRSLIDQTTIERALNLCRMELKEVQKMHNEAKEERNLSEYLLQIANKQIAILESQLKKFHVEQKTYSNELDHSSFTKPAGQKNKPAGNSFPYLTINIYSTPEGLKIESRQLEAQALNDHLERISRERNAHAKG